MSLYIKFDLNTHQGDFTICYSQSSCFIMIDAALDGGGSKPSHRHKIHLHGFPHRKNVLDDFGRFSAWDLEDRYRRYFLNEDILLTGLEHPDDARLARVEVTLRLIQDNQVTLVLREDGRCWHLVDKAVGDYKIRQIPDRPLRHDIPAESIRRWAPGAGCGLSLAEALDRNDFVQEVLRMYWDKLSPQLEHPFIRTEEELKPQLLSLVRGTLDDLTGLARDAALLDEALPDEAFRTGEQMSCYSFHLSAATPFSPPKVHDYQDGQSGLSPKTKRLLRQILRHHRPAGYRIEPQFGCYYDWTGYERLAETIEISLSRSTASDRMEALERIETWLDQIGTPADQCAKYLPDR